MTRAATPRRGHRFTPTLLTAAVAALSLVFAAAAIASPRPGSREEQLLARPIAPAPGEKLQESEVIFTFERGRAASESRIVLLPREFDPTSWTSIPSLDGMVAHDASKGVITLAETGVSLTQSTTWWWTVGSRDAATGAWQFTPARAFTATPRFTNRVAPSPYLMRGVVGSMAPDELKRQRQDAFREMSPISANAAKSAGLTANAASAPDVPHIRLGAGFDFVPGQSLPQVPAELSMSRVPEDAPGGLQSWLVQFNEAPDASDLKKIAEAGGAVFAYIPDQAYLVRGTADARTRLAHQSATAWTGDWQPAYKLSPRIDRASSASSSFEALLFPDADVEATKLALTAIGANVTQSSDNGVNKLVRFSLRGDQVAAAAGLSNVVWIEPLVMPILHNDLAQWVVQTGVSNSRRVWDMGIKGEGQVVNTSDSGINVLHDQFRDPAVPIPGFGDYPTHRKIIAYKLGSNDPNIEFGDHAGASYHGTHTAGTIAGSDDPVGGVSARDGMAKNAKIYFMDISGTALANGVSPPADLNDLFLPPYVGNGGGAARLSSNSWGSTVSGAYTLNSLEVDQFMWAHPDFYIAFSTGNSGSVGSVGSPATSKDCAGMGGTRNGTSENTIYGSTSKGPCADGRRKPTFAAPADGQVANTGLFSANGATTNGYKALMGTSMASPSGTGAVTLIRQYLTEGWYPTGAKVPANGFSPSAALLKALAINSADPITGSPIPDNNAGYGRINDDNVLYFAGDAKKLLLEDFTTGLSSGQFIEYQVNVVDSLVPLEVSLCWTDFPGSPAASVQLVNNLNLTVSKGASAWKGNVYSGTQSVTGGTYDALNVEESVLLTVPTKGIYTVRIDAPTVPVGPQPFGLVITGGVGNGAGTLALDRSEYGSSSTVQLQIIDTNASGPLTVHLSSPTDPAGENATLTGSNGVFTGTLALTPALTSTSDGLLSVSNGDLITATYSDASPVANMAATATVNFSAPVITNVHATSLGASGTLVTWTTDRNSTSRVYYGTTGSLELGSVDSTGYYTSHKVLLTGITPGQTYQYDVESVSLSGSSTRDDKGGAHYRFTGKPSGDIALLMSDPSFGRQFAWTNSLGNNSYDYDLISGTLAASPAVGDLSSGLRSYRAVIWQCGPDDYPPVTDTQRTAIDSYMAGGGRLWILGHDLGWGMADPTSPGYSVARAAWLQSALHANFLMDPATWTSEFGIASDPISGGFAVTPVPYEPFGSGQAGDEISANPGSGSSAFVWRDNATPDNNVLRWTDGASDGSPSTAVWGGQPSRLVSEFLEFTAMAPPFTSASATRDTVLNRTLNWLFGRPRPTIALSAPNGGETLTSSPANITWTETVGPGANVGSRTIEYSIDAGDSWTTLTTSAGASPYSWDLSGIPNTTHARVRIKLIDDGAPSLSMSDASAADFTINIAGNDTNGPTVVPGSIASNPNPIVRGNNITLSATVTDANSGGAAVDAAEWSFGPSPAAAGSGTAMTGAFGSPSVNVSLSIATNGFTLGTQQLWVRGHDAAGNWGPASALSVLVNGTGTTGVDGVPAVAFLGQSAPNPAVGPTTIAFGLARGGAIALDVFDAQGRLVKQLAKGTYAAGYHRAQWDGRDASGSRVGAGLYFYRLVSPEGRFEKRVAMLQ